MSANVSAINKETDVPRSIVRDLEIVEVEVSVALHAAIRRGRSTGILSHAVEVRSGRRCRRDTLEVDPLCWQSNPCIVDEAESRSVIEEIGSTVDRIRYRGLQSPGLTTKVEK